MNDTNLVVLTGHLTRDPEVRYTPNRKAVGSLNLAVNVSVKKGEEWEDEPHYFDVTIFGRQAETVKEFQQKGSQILVEGTLRLDRWETKDGEKKSHVKVIANKIQFIGGKPKGKNKQETEDENQDVPSKRSEDDDIPF